MRGLDFGAASEKETPMSTEILLTVEEAATRLKISKHTLNRWRVTGEGPPFVKYGPRLVRYVDRVLDEWAAGRAHRSTSEYGRESA
jgi:excisionase family DNA binding protein